MYICNSHDFAINWALAVLTLALAHAALLTFPATPLEAVCIALGVAFALQDVLIFHDAGDSTMQ